MQHDIFLLFCLAYDSLTVNLTAMDGRGTAVRGRVLKLGYREIQERISLQLEARSQ
jgi:hypothetical protein